MREFEIIQITKFKVCADFESEAIKKCATGKWDSSQTRYVRFKEMGE